MSGKKRVTFKEKIDDGDDDDKNVKMRRLADVKYDHEYNEDDYYAEKKFKNEDKESDEDESDGESDVKKSGKYSLDSDEEDNADKYSKLKKHVFDEIGEEDKTAEFDNEIKLTPFNMKEELEEGDFDTDGYYHWKSKKGEVHDAWLDNIDWANINELKKFKGQENLLNAAVNSGVIKKNYDLSGENNDESSDDDDNDDDEELQTSNENEQIELFKKIFEYLKPSENITRAIKRLGNKSTGVNKANLSASQRWIKKKQIDVSQTSEDAKKNAEALEKLTSLANKFIEMGYYDIYDETYEKIKLKLDEKLNKNNNNNHKNDEFDIFADNIDESEINKATTSKIQNQIEDKIVKWVYKLTNSDDDEKLFGPYASEDMLKMSLEGKFKETGVWCRKVDDESSSFYNSKRIDFDLYT